MLDPTVVGARWLLDDSTQEVLAVSPIWASGETCLGSSVPTGTVSGVVVDVVQGGVADVAARNEFWTEVLTRRGFSEEHICEVRSTYQVVVGTDGGPSIVEDGLDLYTEPLGVPSVRWSYLVTELDRETFDLVVVLETSSEDRGNISIADSIGGYTANRDGVASVVLGEIPRDLAPGGVASIQEELAVSSGNFGESTHSASVFPEACDLSLIHI